MKGAVSTTTRRGNGALGTISAHHDMGALLTREYQTIFKNNGKPMVIIEADATISLANAEFERLSGYTKKEIEGKKNWTEFVVREDRRRVKEYHRLRASDPMLTPRCFEFRFLDRRGQVRNIVLTIGEIPGTHKSMASLQDITERRRAEREQRASEERYKTLFENARDAIYIATPDGTYVDANHAALALFGYTREEMGRVNTRQLYADPADARKFQQEMEEKGFVQDFVVRLCKKDRTEMDCLLTATAQRGDDGSILEYQGTLRDITEHKQREGLLQHEKEIFFTTLEHSPHGVILLDKDKKYVYVNPEFTNITGYTLEDIPTGKDWLQKVYPDPKYRQEVIEAWKKDFSNKRFDSTFSGVCKDGELKELNFKGVVLEDGRAIIMLSDITERKRMQEKLQESEELHRILVDNIRFGINLIDADRTIIMVNAAQAKHFKKSGAQFVGKKCFQEFEKRDAVCPHCPAIQAMATKKPAEAETVLTADDGSQSHVRVQAFPIVAKDGTVTSFIEIAEIITERKEMEALLRQERETFFSILDKAPYGVILTDKEGKALYMNPEFTNITGYTSADISTMVEWAHTAYPDKAYRHEVSQRWKKDVIEKETNEVSEVFRVRCKDGEERDVEFRATTLGDGRVIVMLSDITERRRMEEGLKESEARFKMLSEKAPFAISVMTPDKRFEYFNPRFTEIFGYTKEDLPDKDTWFKKAYPDEAYRKEISSKWQKDLKEDVKVEEKESRVFTVRCKDGQDKIISFKIVYLNDGKQYLTYRDITDRVKAEEALRHSEERFRTLVETMRVGLSAIDENGVITYANERLSEIWGYPMEEIIGHSTLEFLDEENLKILQGQLAKRRKGESGSYEIAWRRKDGQNIHTILSPTPLFDANGRYTGSYGFITDITERKLMEEQLQKSETLHRSLIETTKVGVNAINENGVIIYVNERLCDIWGYAPNEIMGRRVGEFLDEENLKILQDHLAKRREGGRESYEIAWRRKDGQNVSTILAPTPIFDAEGHFKGSYGFITDITERKRIEERLQRYTADLERSNEEIKNFAYIVSHDLRVPLVNLKGYSAELGAALKTLVANFEAVLPQLPEEKKSEVALALHEDIPEALEFITNSVSRMDHFINAVLLLSRLGRRDLKPERLAMDALVKQIVEGMSHQVQEKGITITVAPLPEVVADRTSIEQIMGNILGNAVKYLDQGRLGTIEVTGQANGSETTFRIQDNGRGIAVDDMNKVFAPFRRAGKQDTPGEGMGLAYVQTLVRRHNGSISCESELGKGTTFTFTIASAVKQEVSHG